MVSSSSRMEVCALSAYAHASRAAVTSVTLRANNAVGFPGGHALASENRGASGGCRPPPSARRLALPHGDGNDETLRRHKGDRRHPCSGRSVRSLSAGGARRRRDQGGASRRSRSEPWLRHRQSAQSPQHGHRVPDPGLQQAVDRARSQERAGSRDPQAAGGDGGRVRGELSPRCIRGARARLRGLVRDQSAR